MKNSFLIKFLLFFLVSTLSLLFLAAFLTKNDSSSLIPTSSLPQNPPKYTKVIIDAGHGGEDGGTSGKNGLVEKEVNLSIAKMLADMLRLSGVDVIMTREDDRLLYDRNCDFKGRKKKLDLAARKNIADSNPDAIFISIHMNAYPDEIYSGLQVWYSPNVDGSKALAELIQSNCRESLQKDNIDVIACVFETWNKKKCEWMEREAYFDPERPLPPFESGDYVRYITQSNFVIQYEILQKKALEFEEVEEDDYEE